MSAPFTPLGACSVFAHVATRSEPQFRSQSCVCPGNLRRMWWKSLGLSCALGVFVGCGADPGTEGNELPAVSEVTSAATGCQSFVGTISDQVAAGRAFEQDTQFLIWTLPAYYATGGTELIGSSPTQTVTLYPKTGGGFTANASLCEASVCGDGILQSPAEACDGTAFPSGSAPAGGTPACSQYSDQYVAGNVSCTADCKVDFSACRKSVCGDGKAEGTEQCDGSDSRRISDLPGQRRRGCLHGRPAQVQERLHLRRLELHHGLRKRQARPWRRLRRATPRPDVCREDLRELHEPIAGLSVLEHGALRGRAAPLRQPVQGEHEPLRVCTRLLLRVHGAKDARHPVSLSRRRTSREARKRADAR